MQNRNDLLCESISFEEQIVDIRRSFDQAEAAHLHDELSQNRSGITSMLEIRRLHKAAQVHEIKLNGLKKEIPDEFRTLYSQPALPSPPHSLLASKSPIQQEKEINCCSPTTFDDREEEDKEKVSPETKYIVYGDEGFASLWHKLVYHGWKSHKGKGLTSWLYLRPGASHRSTNQYHYFTDPNDVMTFVEENKIDGVNRKGDIDENYDNIESRQTYAEERMEGSENMEDEQSMLEDERQYFSYGVPLINFGIYNEKSQPEGKVIIKLAKRGTPSTERVELDPKPLSMGLSDWIETPKNPGYITHLHSLPVAVSYVRLKRNFRVQDQKSFEFTPYFGENDRSQEKVFGDLFDLEERQKTIDAGPEAVVQYHQNRYDAFRAIILDNICHQCFETKNKPSSSRKRIKKSKTSSSPNNKPMIEDDLGGVVSAMNCMLESVVPEVFGEIPCEQSYCQEELNDAIEEMSLGFNLRAKKVRKPTRNRSFSPQNRILPPRQSSLISSSSDSNLSKTKSTAKKKKDLKDYPYSMQIDSYRHLFCRFCYSYDCHLHEDYGGHAAPAALDLQTRHALQAAPSLCSLNPAPLVTPPTTSPKPMPEAIEDQGRLRGVYERFWIIFDGSMEKIALALNLSLDLTREIHQSIESELPDIKDLLVEQKKAPLNKKKTLGNNSSRVRYHLSQLKAGLATTACAPYTPCKHSLADCSDNCNCVNDAHWCTKFCICAPPNLQSKEVRKQGGLVPCPNFFVGCHCKMGHCNTKACPCFTAGRECDPDVCRECGSCEAVGSNCRNNNLAKGKHARLLLARSSLPNAGWGLFTLHDIAKGSFVHEYAGEVVTQQEAERRGRLYDKLNCSYLFNLNADFCVDAARKGNKMRFANHSSKPNVEPRVTYVNGEHKIGMFAKEDIKAQAELFFDYGYDKEIRSASLHKQAVYADWMSDPKMANTISKNVGRTMVSEDNENNTILIPKDKSSKKRGRKKLQKDSVDTQTAVSKKSKTSC